MTCCLTSSCNPFVDQLDIKSHKNKMYEIICISIYRNVYVKLLSNT